MGCAGSQRGHIPGPGPLRPPCRPHFLPLGRGGIAHHTSPESFPLPKLVPKQCAARGPIHTFTAVFPCLLSTDCLNIRLTMAVVRACSEALWASARGHPHPGRSAVQLCGAFVPWCIELSDL